METSAKWVEWNAKQTIYHAALIISIGEVIDGLIDVIERDSVRSVEGNTATEIN